VEVRGTQHGGVAIHQQALQYCRGDPEPVVGGGAATYKPTGCEQKVCTSDNQMRVPEYLLCLQRAFQYCRHTHKAK
jgi:hypothetical protein